MIFSWTSLAFVDRANVRDLGPHEVAARGDVAQMIVELVCAADHVLAAFQCLVQNNDRMFIVPTNICPRVIEWGFVFITSN